MKVKIISELISAITIGALFGLVSNGTHDKWHRLGREAFLSHESQNFERMYANPAPAMHGVLLWVFVALTVFVLYKGLAFIAAKVLSAFSDESEAVQN
jgi:hypothetical protein